MENHNKTPNRNMQLGAAILELKKNTHTHIKKKILGVRSSNNIDKSEQPLDP
jgi:hypothetical protein